MACPSPSTTLRALGHRRQRRGFTLIELIVVVIIISVLAVIAIPAITAQVRDRRTRQAAQEVASIYRDARMRAMGRGAAVLVRYTKPNAEGQLQMREGIRGSSEPDANCQSLPVSSCFVPDWADGGASNRLLDTLNPTLRNEFKNVHIEMDASLSATNVSQLDLCFTPLGSVYVSDDQGNSFKPLTAIPQARVWRKGEDGKPVGLERLVLIVPNGNARLGTSEQRAP
jgi:prepilin-type N-terminal cleavage/methylation domain-containing protein